MVSGNAAEVSGSLVCKREGVSSRLFAPTEARRFNFKRVTNNLSRFDGVKRCFAECNLWYSNDARHWTTIRSRQTDVHEGEIVEGKWSEHVNRLLTCILQLCDEGDRLPARDDGFTNAHAKRQFTIR